MHMFVLQSRCLFYTPLTASGQVTKPTDEQLSVVFQKDLVMNIFRDGVFGSFRHISLSSGCFWFITRPFIVVDYLLC